MESEKIKIKYWYALYVKPKHEFKVKKELEVSSVQNYLPVISKVKQWSDRKKKIDEPLIKGYIFIYADERERLNSLESKSVVKCICDKGIPAKIPDWQIENLKQLLSHKGEFDVINKIITGTTIEIINGPFKGVRGIVSKVENMDKLAVTIELLNRSVVVHLPKESVVKKVTLI